ncbi:hypothetical protein [Actinomadura madurae]|uniref:hypothetical protein n=1 Tax=Actinomadura madurae TaxID=1993 RepID=UPI0015EE59B3|nr:hypothetical protein [Actinomadura madurae]
MAASSLSDLKKFIFTEVTKTLSSLRKPGGRQGRRPHSTSTPLIGNYNGHRQHFHPHPELFQFYATIPSTGLDNTDMPRQHHIFL